MGEHCNLRTIVERARASCSGRGTSPPPPSATWSPSLPATSRPTWARSFTTSTRLLTPCSPTCPKATTRSARYRFASKTLMRILPTSLKSEVEGLIEKKAITLDLYEILGQCTWGQKAAEK